VDLENLRPKRLTVEMLGSKLPLINVKKTAVYTNVNGDIMSYTSKTAKIKKVILPSTLTFGDVFFLHL